MSNSRHIDTVRFLCLIAVWFLIVAGLTTDIIGVSSYQPWPKLLGSDLISVVAGIVLALLTLIYWFKFSARAVFVQPASQKIVTVIFAGLSLPLVAGLYLLSGSNSSWSNIFSYAENSSISYRSIESYIMFGAFPAIGFLAMDRDSNLANWFNGFLTAPLVFQFWPRQDQTVGWSCSGRFLDEDDGWLGSVCNNVELTYDNAVSYTEHMASVWNLDQYGYVLADFFNMTIVVFVNLMLFGIAHFYLRKPKLTLGLW